MNICFTNYYSQVRSSYNFFRNSVKVFGQLPNLLIPKTGLIAVEYLLLLQLST